MSKVKLDAKTASDVVDFRKDNDIQSVDTLKRKLPSSEVSEVRYKLETLDAKDAAALADKYDFKTVKADSMRRQAAPPRR